MRQLNEPGYTKGKKQCCRQCFKSSVLGVERMGTTNPDPILLDFPESFESERLFYQLPCSSANSGSRIRPTIMIATTKMANTNKNGNRRSILDNHPAK